VLVVRAWQQPGGGFLARVLDLSDPGSDDVTVGVASNATEVLEAVRRWLAGFEAAGTEANS
jgi:hypothetical protein